ncbi:MAG: tetratricopeptide repeat protein [Proteobacteria bacterium]|nr:tetratricopeptide repeat protein [Pseudomonadota bacterium]
MSLTDRFGNALTSSSADAVDLYNSALDALLAMQPMCSDLIQRALVCDPGFALAHCVLARSLVLEGKNPQAFAAIDRAQELTVGLTPRERAHVEIVAMVTRGQTAQALPLVKAHAAEYPRDVLPLSFTVGVYGLFGFGGYVNHHELQLEFLQSVASHWDDAWWFSASLGWSHVEVLQLDTGIPMLERSLQQKADNASAVHGRTHGYYERGQAAEGAEFIADWLPGYDRAGPLHCHLAWHQALFSLQQGDVENAAEIYRESIRPDVSQAMPMFTIVDCTALLWRFQLHGISVNDKDVDRLVKFMEKTFPSTAIPFVNVHAVMAYALAGDHESVARRLNEVADLVAADRQNSGPVVLHLCQAVKAYAEGMTQQAVRLLDQARPQWSALGGSNAQRDVFFETLLGAVILDGDRKAANKLALERSGQRSAHLGQAWFDRFKPQVRV